MDSDLTEGKVEAQTEAMNISMAWASVKFKRLAVPVVPNGGLLILRIGSGLSLAILHGLPKVGEFASFCQGHPWGFVDLIRSMGFPFPAFFAVLATLGESLCAAFVACGVFTRAAATAVTLTMFIAMYTDVRTGTSIESAYLYAVPFVTIALTGPGTLAMDRLLKKNFHWRRPPAP